MNALRKTRLCISFALVALLAISLTTTTAEACGYNNSFHGYRSFGYPVTYAYGSYRPVSYRSTYQYTARPISYPVTYYDCYGRPYIVWQTGYSSLSY